MKKADNFKIIERLLELCKNDLHYNTFPKPFKEEYIFLANILNDSLARLEHEFDEAFKFAVGRYKNSLESNKGYGWFNDPQKLIWINTQINQIKYIIYGNRHVRELVFKEELGNEAYKDLIEQIDSTIFLTERQKKARIKKTNKMVDEVLNEILKEEKEGK